jgi:hypothetical protein
VVVQGGFLKFPQKTISELFYGGVSNLSLSYFRFYNLYQNKLKQLLNGNEEFASNLASLGDETSIDFGEMPLSVALFLSIIIKRGNFRNPP